mmetsp:Transcript_19576/g.48432  ORF Transcript_19576/g.48432 Transcript_19576/m.48432 type:complete len:221 (+) Transcript_19576:477-1139(+)
MSRVPRSVGRYRRCFTRGSSGLLRNQFFSRLLPRNTTYPATLIARMSARNHPSSSLGCSKIYRACSEYVKGTQTRSPKASMKPKPSVVTSMVVRIAVSNHRASTTYSAWNAHTSPMAGDTAPVVWNCRCANPRSSSNHPMSPGTSSQNTLRSKPPMRGFSSRPMKKSYTQLPESPPLASVLLPTKEPAYRQTDRVLEKMMAAVRSAKKLACTHPRSKLPL